MAMVYHLLQEPFQRHVEILQDGLSPDLSIDFFCTFSDSYLAA
jgi:hypothetical protein